MTLTSRSRNLYGRAWGAEDGTGDVTTNHQHSKHSVAKRYMPARSVRGWARCPWRLLVQKGEPLGNHYMYKGTVQE